MAGTDDGVGALLEEVSHRWAAVGEQPAELIDTLLETLASVLGDRRDACYVSTPITTGPEFIAWWRAQGSTMDRDDAAYQDEIWLVVRRNIEAVRPLRPAGRGAGSAGRSSNPPGSARSRPGNSRTITTSGSG